MKIAKMFALALAVAGVSAFTASADTNDDFVTNSFNFTFSYIAPVISTNGDCVMPLLVTNVLAQSQGRPTTHGGFGGISTYTTNITSVTTTKTITVKDFIAALNTDMDYESDLYYFVTNSGYTNIPSTAKLTVFVPSILSRGGDRAGEVHVFLNIGTNSFDLSDDADYAEIYVGTDGDYYRSPISSKESQTSNTDTKSATVSLPVKLVLQSSDEGCYDSTMMVTAYTIVTLNQSSSAFYPYSEDGYPLVSSFNTTSVAGTIHFWDINDNSVYGTLTGSFSGSGSGYIWTLE